VTVWDFGAARGALNSLTITNPALAEPVLGDFNGDSYGDIFCFNPGLAPEALSVGTIGKYNALAAPERLPRAEADRGATGGLRGCRPRPDPLGGRRATRRWRCGGQTAGSSGRGPW
jgi:hypothetical protein